MTVRYCPTCYQNVITVVQKSNCKHCDTITQPLDTRLPIPEDGEENDLLKGKRRKD